MDARPVPPPRRPARSLLLVPIAVLAFVALGCDPAFPSPEPSTSEPAALRPSILLDQTWTALDGQWTFTGRVDPFDDPTDVVLEVGPGGAGGREFDSVLPVAEDLTEPGPLTITTADLPDIELICVRFKATNAGGSSASTPLCIPHDIPSFAPAAPTITISDDWTTSGEEWTFRGRLDPGRVATDVVLEIGTGPASAPQFETSVPVGRNLTDASTLTFSTAEIPDADEVCVRFTATNDLGSSSSDALCFAPAAGGGSAEPS